MKTKTLLYTALLLCIFSIYGCSGDKPADVDPAAGIRKAKFEKLLSHYQPATIDSLEVFYNGAPGEKFTGTKIDSNDVALFPADLRKECSYGETFACYKLEIDSSRTGLITRVPSMYESSSVRLFIYDHKLDTILYHIELSENWGDAGEIFTKISWICKTPSPRIYTIENYAYDHSVDNDGDDATEEIDTAIERSITYITSGLNRNHVDTLSKKTEAFKEGPGGGRLE